MRIIEIMQNNTTANPLKKGPVIYAIGIKYPKKFNNFIRKFKFKTLISTTGLIHFYFFKFKYFLYS